MKSPTPPLLATALLTAAMLAAPQQSTATVILDDTFANDDPTGSIEKPGFWTLQTVGSENGIYERNGFLNLLASGAPYTFACLNSKLSQDLNFFRHAVTVSALDLLQDFSGIKPSEAFFRVSINSTEKRQTASPQSISLRFSPGELFLGFKTAAYGKADAENMQGNRVGSVWQETFDGNITGFSLTLDPSKNSGYVMCTAFVFTTGSRPVLTFSGALELSASDWSPDEASAIIIETRRNASTADPASYSSVSIGRIIVSSTP